MDVVEKALIAAGVDVAKKMENFLKENGVNPGNIKNYEIIQEQKKKAMEITILKKPGFFGKLIGKRGEKIATMGVYFDGLVNDFIDKIKAEETKPMGTAVEDINAGDLVEIDTKTGQIKKAKQNLEKPLSSKKAKNEKDPNKKSWRKKETETKKWAKGKDSI